LFIESGHSSKTKALFKLIIVGIQAGGLDETANEVGVGARLMDDDK
jgi:hypothetical protein